MEPFNTKIGILEALRRALASTEQNPRRLRRGMIKSNAPRPQKKRAAHSPKPRKPAPRGRVELLAKQKKARPIK